MAGVSPHCKRVIKDFEENPKCYDFRAIRAYTACMGWKLFEEEKISFSEAMKKAWIKARKLCK